MEEDYSPGIGSLIRPANTLPPLTPAPSAPKNTFETIADSYTRQRMSENIGSQSFVMQPLYDERDQILEQVTGKKIEDVWRLVGVPVDREDRQRKIDAFIQQGRETDRDLYTEIPTSEELRQTAAMRVNSAIADDENAVYTSGFAKVFGGFVGAAAGYIADPVQSLTTVASGGVGTAVARGLLQRVLVESAVGAGITAVEQVPVMEWNESLGIEYGLDRALGNVLLGGAFSGAAPIAGEVLSRALPAVKLKASDTLDVVARNESLPPSVRNAAAYFERYVHVDEANPYPRSMPDRFTKHVDNLQKAEEAILAGRAIEVEDIQLNIPKNTFDMKQIISSIESINKINDYIEIGDDIEFNPSKSFRENINDIPDEKFSEFEFKMYDAAESYVEKVKNSLSDVLDKAGYKIAREDKSRQSESAYWYVTKKTEQDDDSAIKVRFSDHGDTGSGEGADVYAFWGEDFPVMFGKLFDLIDNEASAQKPILQTMDVADTSPNLFDEPTMPLREQQELVQEAMAPAVDDALMADAERLARDVPDFAMYLEDGSSVSFKQLLDEVKADEDYLQQIRTCAVAA